MPKSPAFQFYAAEYLADEDVQLMSLEEEGCYIRLLAYCWREGSIPSNLDKLSRLCKGASTTVVRVVADCFHQDPTDSSRLLHKRLEMEREKQRLWREKSSRGGLKSAEVRANKESIPVEPPLQPPLEPNGNTASLSSSLSSPLTPKKQKPSHKESPADPRFALFKIDFEDDFQYHNKVPAPWEVKEGSNLSRWLKANPQITQEQWRDILRNRRSSPVNKSAPLSLWIGKALSWLAGPADEWGKPLQKNNNSRNGGKTNGHVVEGNCDNLKTALASLDCEDNGENHGNGLFSSSTNQSGLSEIYVSPLIEGKS